MASRDSVIYLWPRFSSDCGRTSQCIIAHPVNPPYYAPMVEIIPHDLTTQEVRQKTRDLMSTVGQKPVLLNREIDGFALNRIQYAVINESWRLVQGIWGKLFLQIIPYEVTASRPLHLV